MDALLLGALAGALFGLFAVAVRYGLSSGVPVELGAAVTSATGFLVVSAIALVSGAFSEHMDGRDVLVFAAIGAAVPGLSQIAFNQAVRHAGAARTAVLIGVAPLLSFVLAAVFLGESVSPGLIAGAALIVAAGASLSFERVRPEGFRTIGAAAGRALRRPVCDSRHAHPLGVGRRHARSAASHRGLARGRRARARGVGVADAQDPPADQRCAPPSSRSCLRASVSAPPTSV